MKKNDIVIFEYKCPELYGDKIFKYSVRDKYLYKTITKMICREIQFKIGECILSVEDPMYIYIRHKNYEIWRLFAVQPTIEYYAEELEYEEENGEI